MKKPFIRGKIAQVIFHAYSTNTKLIIGSSILLLLGIYVITGTEPATPLRVRMSTFAVVN